MVTFFESATCKSGWISWDNSCYDINTRLYANKYQAQLECEDDFSNLLFIDSKEEQIFFAEKLGHQREVNFPPHNQLKCKKFFFYT